MHVGMAEVILASKIAFLLLKMAGGELWLQLFSADGGKLFLVASASRITAQDGGKLPNPCGALLKTTACVPEPSQPPCALPWSLLRTVPPSAKPPSVRNLLGTAARVPRPSRNPRTLAEPSQNPPRNRPEPNWAETPTAFNGAKLHFISYKTIFWVLPNTHLVLAQRMKLFFAQTTAFWFSKGGNLCSENKVTFGLFCASGARSALAAPTLTEGWAKDAAQCF